MTTKIVIIFKTHENELCSVHIAIFKQYQQEEMEMKKVPPQAVHRQIIALIPVFLNVFMMGCTGGWVANAIYFFLLGDEVTATATEISLVASSTELGRMLFAIPGGLLVDKYGRKKIIMCAGFTHFFSWLILSVHSSMPTLIITRFTLGIATALVNSSSLVSIGEIASPNVRGKITSIYQIFFRSGMITPCIFTAVFSSYYSLCYGIAVLSSLCCVSMFWATETPDHLVKISKDEKAKNTLKRIRLGYSEDDINCEFEKLKKYIDEEKTRKQQLSWLTFITSKSIAKPLATCALLNFFAMSIGTPVLNAYTTAIYPESNYIPKKYYPLIVQMLDLTMSVCMTFFIERFSRRSIFMTGAATMAIIHAVCAAVNFCYTEFHVDALKWVFVATDLSRLLIFCGSVQPMNSAIKSELLPQTVRGIGGAFGVIGQALANIVSYQLYQFSTQNFNIYYLYVIFSINSLVLCSLVFFLLPEGRGKFLADVQMEFNKK